jgi:hypothetical protein
VAWESRPASATEDESIGTRGGVDRVSAVEEELTIFTSFIQELHISVIMDKSCIFDSPFASSEIISLMHSVSQTTHFRFGSPSASSLPLPHRSRVRSPPRRPARKCLLLPSALDTSSLILLHVSSSLLLRPCSRGSTSPLPVRLQDSTLCHAAVEPKRRTALHREGG